jgi:hypothetical protein
MSDNSYFKNGQFFSTRGYITQIIATNISSNYISSNSIDANIINAQLELYGGGLYIEGTSYLEGNLRVNGSPGKPAPVINFASKDGSSYLTEVDVLKVYEDAYFLYDTYFSDTTWFNHYTIFNEYLETKKGIISNLVQYSPTSGGLKTGTQKGVYDAIVYALGGYIYLNRVYKASGILRTDRGAGYNSGVMPSSYKEINITGFKRTNSELIFYGDIQTMSSDFKYRTITPTLGSFSIDYSDDFHSFFELIMTT